MNIILFTADNEDYLSDSILHGLRQLFGGNVVDYPKKDCMYKNHPPDKKVYGNGFTLYRTLDDIQVDRDNIENKLLNNFFDLIIIADIQRQSEIYKSLLKYLTPRNTIILDGEDNDSIFPFKTIFYKNYFSIKKPHKHFLYFKRELTTKSIKSLCYNMLSAKLCSLLTKTNNIHPVSFSIPDEKIVKSPPIEKDKLFPSHIVDNEISEKVNSSVKYAFTKEQDYYHDLQTSRFGITMKRGGWDCLRHYEIAANGTVPCFRNLEIKPESCAPHGLNNTNCISYTSYDDLMHIINNLSEEKYLKLQKNAITWAHKNTTRASAERVLSILEKHKNRIS